jgi:hypothetical protein
MEGQKKIVTTGEMKEHGQSQILAASGAVESHPLSQENPGIASNPEER